MRILIGFIFCIAILLQGGYMRFENLTDSFISSCQMVITIENNETILEKGDEKYQLILEEINEITKYSHEMPAFGVSIDNHTRQDKQTGTWIELRFDKTCKYNGMDFDALLFKVEKDWYGFNLIRKNNQKYEGRCFYLSLDNSMESLAETLEQLSLTEFEKGK